MGALTLPPSGSVYLDTQTVIYSYPQPSPNGPHGARHLYRGGNVPSAIRDLRIATESRSFISRTRMVVLATGVRPTSLGPRHRK